MAGHAADLFAPSSPGSPLDLASFERFLRGEGYNYVAGVDEVGRGALAGPVVAAAVVLPADYDCARIDDSKKLDAAVRAYLWDEITAGAVSWAVGVSSSRYIDKVNILNAALVAMKRASERLAPRPDILLVDGNRPVPTLLRQKTVVGGDGKCACIAAASILAKVYRDRLMTLVDAKYPAYGFAVHKGYGTEEHLMAIAAYGPAPVHRRSFRPFGPTADGAQPLFGS